MTEDEAIAARRAARASWTIRKFKLGEEPLEELIIAPPAELLGMVTALTLQAWALSGKPMPIYSRAEMPGRVIRPSD